MESGSGSMILGREGGREGGRREGREGRDGEGCSRKLHRAGRSLPREGGREDKRAGTERRRTTRLEMRGRCQRPSTKWGLNASAPYLSRRRLILCVMCVGVGVWEEWSGRITRRSDG